MFPSKYYYIVSLLVVFVLPAVVEGFFVIGNISILNLLTFVSGILILGSIWDIWATRHGQRDPIWLWQFNFKDTLGIKIFGLPIEEYLFYVSASVYIVFSWESIKYATETGNVFIYLLLSMLSVWSLLMILIPYKLRIKKDKVL